jgi:hypothetical protein
MAQEGPTALALPLPGRVGHVGGIESITIDGTRWYFGFDFKEDITVSPLIADADAMAEFASRYMLQTDGRHDAVYWRELVGWAAEDSELSDCEASREFSTAEFRRIAADLARAQAGDRPLPGIRIEYHLLYLLDAASNLQARTKPADPSYTEAQQRLGFTAEQWAPDAVEILSGESPLPEGARYADAATLVRRYLAAAIGTAPGNWRTLFRDLAAP